MMSSLLIVLPIILLIAGIYFLFGGKKEHVGKKEGDDGKLKEGDNSEEVDEKDSIPPKETKKGKGYSNDLYFFYYLDSNFIKVSFDQLEKDTYKVTGKEETFKGGGKVSIVGQELNGEVIRTQKMEANELTNNEKYKMIVERLTKKSKVDLVVFEPNRGIVDKDMTKMEDAISTLEKQNIHIDDDLLEQVRSRKDAIMKDIKNQIFEKAQEGNQEGNQDGKLSLLKNFLFKIVKKVDPNGEITGFDLRSEITLKDMTGRVIDKMPISALLNITGRETGITPEGFSVFKEIAHEDIEQASETYLTILGTVKYTRKKDLTSILITPYVIPIS